MWELSDSCMQRRVGRMVESQKTDRLRVSVRVLKRYAQSSLRMEKQHGW